MTRGRKRYLLDTDALSSLIREPDGAVSRLVARAGADCICTSIVVACELRFGAEKRGRRELSARIDDLLSAIAVLPLNPGVDRHYARIRVELERAGHPIGANDLLIAAHAAEAGCTLVTANRREFDRVRGLHVQGWS